MGLEGLQHVLRVDARILVVKPGYKSERDVSPVYAIDPRSAVLVPSERKSQRVDDLAFGDPPLWKLPDLLNANAVRLRVALLLKIESADKLLGAVAPGAFSEDGDL